MILKEAEWPDSPENSFIWDELIQSGKPSKQWPLSKRKETHPIKASTSNQHLRRRLDQMSFPLENKASAGNNQPVTKEDSAVWVDSRSVLSILKCWMPQISSWITMWWNLALFSLKTIIDYLYEYFKTQLLCQTSFSHFRHQMSPLHRLWFRILWSLLQSSSYQLHRRYLWVPLLEDQRISLTIRPSSNRTYFLLPVRNRSQSIAL